MYDIYSSCYQSLSTKVVEVALYLKIVCFEQFVQISEDLVSEAFIDFVLVTLYFVAVTMGYDVAVSIHTVAVTDDHVPTLSNSCQT